MTTAKSKSKSKSEADYYIKDCRSTIRKMLLGQATIDEAAKCVLDSGWNYRDPELLMKKDPKEVYGFLKSLTTEIGLFSGMRSEGRQNLLQMICDAYCRALSELKGE